MDKKIGTLMATEVTLDELADVIDRGGFVLDVREQDEWNEGHVPNAHHIPMNEVAENLDKLDDGARIFIICRSGKRSMTVANYLEAQGYDVVSVAGGTDGWANSGRDLSFEPSL
jgi:rhodanese-related sulfurtransferase